MLWLLLNCAGTESRPSLFPHLLPAKQITWGGRRTIACSVTPCSATKNGVQEEEEGREGWLPRLLLLRDWPGSSLLVGGGERLALHHLWFPPPFFHLFSCLDLDLWVFSLLVTLFSPLSHSGVDVSEMQELGVLQGGGKELGILDSCMASWGCELWSQQLGQPKMRWRTQQSTLCTKSPPKKHLSTKWQAGGLRPPANHRTTLWYVSHQLWMEKRWYCWIQLAPQ